MKSKRAIAVLASTALVSGVAFAQTVNVPGIGSAAGGSTVKNSMINVTGNKAEGVTAGGGSLGVSGVAKKLIGAEAKMDGVANVNSVNVTGSRVEDSTISVDKNTAKDVNAIGGTANVNSVNIN